MAQNAVFERLAQIADISALTKEERLKYDEGIKQYRDAINVYEGAILAGRAEGLKEGEAKGRAEGLKEGEAKGVLSTARSMKAAGLEVGLIAQITGLSTETIKEL